MILFIDDEAYFMEQYVEALKSKGYEVILEDNLDKAFEIIQEKYHNIELLIMDILIPTRPGQWKIIEGQDTKGGLRTGEVFLRKVIEWEEQQGKEGIPKIILTNVASPDFLGKYQDPSSPVEACLRKSKTTLADLVEVVSRLKREIASS